MLKLIKYLKGYIKESVIGPLFKLLEACFELIVPLVMANIIDIGIKNGDKAYILKMGGIMVLLGVLGLVCSLTAQYFAARAALGFGTALRNDLFAHVNSLSLSEIDKIGTSTLITRITGDVSQVQTGVNLVLRLLLRSPFIVAGAVIMSFTIHAELALIFLAVSLLISLVIYLIMTRSVPHYKSAQSKLDRVSLITRENLSGVRVIRAFSRQKDELERFGQAHDDLTGTQLLVGRISALLNPATYLVLNAGIIAILWFGGITVYHGDISQGEVIALINYMSQILLALLALSNLIISVTRASASAVRINEIFAVKPSMADGGAALPGEASEDQTAGLEVKKTGPGHPKAGSMEAKAGPGAPKVEFRDVSFSYNRSDEKALSDITFQAGSGETIGIIGGTGSGKTTLVSLIPRFYDVTGGEVLIDGINVKDYPFSELRKKVAVVPQKAVLFRGTIRQNMQWGKKDATDEEIYKALEIAQAREFVDAKPDGLDTMVMQGGTNLSGGQRQRLTIARALVAGPQVLILDDSSSALDFATEARLRKSLMAQTRDMTVFIVSQRASSIKHADRIIVLDNGMVAGIGKHDELLETCEVYREICLSQLSEDEVKRK
ncbi:MAG TPA: ABC transporter ATP-binding protein [Clostridiales bacterium]|nr:ABC transporter ATP-binding protein [Clostridiales bacterium]